MRAIQSRGQQVQPESEQAQRLGAASFDHFYCKHFGWDQSWLLEFQAVLAPASTVFPENSLLERVNCAFVVRWRGRRGVFRTVRGRLGWS